MEETVAFAEQLIKEQDELMEKHSEVLETACRKLKTIRAIRLLIQQHYNTQLQELQTAEQQMGAQSDKNNKFEQLSQQEQQLCKELSSQHQTEQELSAQCVHSKMEAGSVAENVDRLQADIDRLENETTIHIPKRREEINLYDYVSRITWDFDHAGPEVKGYVKNSDDVKPFVFDERTCSQLYMTSTLWGSMKEG